MDEKGIEALLKLFKLVERIFWLLLHFVYCARNLVCCTSMVVFRGQSCQVHWICVPESCGSSLLDTVRSWVLMCCCSQHLSVIVMASATALFYQSCFQACCLVSHCSHQIACSASSQSYVVLISVRMDSSASASRHATSCTADRSTVSKDAIGAISRKIPSYSTSVKRGRLSCSSHHANGDAHLPFWSVQCWWRELNDWHNHASNGFMRLNCMDW